MLLYDPDPALRQAALALLAALVSSPAGAEAALVRCARVIYPALIAEAAYRCQGMLFVSGDEEQLNLTERSLATLLDESEVWAVRATAAEVRVYTRAWELTSARVSHCHCPTLAIDHKS
jgi:hypothetical protein